MRSVHRGPVDALCAAVCVCLLAAACARERVTRVVLISLDTLRQDALTAEHMPRTFAWAQRGLVFERHYSATSTTQPTHASLFTGLHPWQHGVTRNGAILPDRFETLAERLKDRGYSTHAVVASFPLQAGFGFAQGFDDYVDDFAMQDWIKDWAGFPVAGGFSSHAESALTSASRLLDAATSPRQFHFFHFFDAHAPYGDAAGDAEALTDEDVLLRIASGDGDADELIALARRGYARDLRVLDGALGDLLDRLMGEPGFETHVVVVSDHGESFGEGGSMGHGKRLTEEQLRVPLFVLSPRVDGGVRSDPVGSVDVARTLLGLAGARADDLAAADLLAAPVAAAHRVVGMRRTFANPYPERRIDGSIHVIAGSRFYAVDGDRLLTGDEAAITLGDLPRRPADDARSERVKQMFGRFQQELAAVSTSERLDDETRAALEALGYAR
jgi:hypothetical protein